MAATEHQSSKHKHHGIALIPSPSSDPRDPLRWPQSLKLLAIFSVSLFNFAGNFAGSGFSVATPVLEQEFQKSASEVNSLLTVGSQTHKPLSLSRLITVIIVQLPSSRTGKLRLGSTFGKVWKAIRPTLLDDDTYGCTCLDIESGHLQQLAWSPLCNRICCGCRRGEFRTADVMPRHEACADTQCQSIIPGIVADVFFLHEMASMVAM